MAIDAGTAKVIQLIQRLHLATEQKTIEWEETDRKQAYAYATKSSSVIVASIDNDGSMPFELQILDEKGNVIESLRSHVPDEDSEFTYITLPGGNDLRNLYELVRRSVLGIEEKLDELLAGLPELPEEPPF